MIATIILFVYLVLFAAPASTYCHEVGHAIGAKLAGAESIKVTIGKGKQTFNLSINKINTVINSLYFFGGYTASSRKKAYTNLELIFIALMGPLTNGVIAFLLFFLYGKFPSIYVELAFWFNVWLAIVNIIPFKFNEKHTDGYTVYKIATDKKNR